MMSFLLQGEAGNMFPYQKTQRPSSLPLPISQRGKQTCTQTEAPQELKQFAGSLVDGVIKTVSETNSDCGGDNQDEDTITDDNVDLIHENSENGSSSETVSTLKADSTS